MILGVLKTVLKLYRCHLPKRKRKSLTSGPITSLKGKLNSYWQYNSRMILSAIFLSLEVSSPSLFSPSKALSGRQAKLTQSRHCHVSLSLKSVHTYTCIQCYYYCLATHSTLRFGMWQNWWKTFGHLSQQTNSPPSIQTAHQSSFGSSFPVSAVFSLLTIEGPGPENCVTKISSSKQMWFSHHQCRRR